MAKILIVDDEAECRESLRALLSLQGFDIEVAANGAEAVDLGRSFIPDVLVVDLVLGDEMDGIQIAEALRSLNPAMEVVMVTGYLTADLEARIKEGLRVRCLVKPVDPSELLLAVRQAARPHTSGSPPYN